jgi:hypothetical protein
MVDTKVTLFDGAYHEVDSSWMAFEIAARTDMREGAGKAGVKLLEPIMDLEVVSPGDFCRPRDRRSQRSPRPDPQSGDARQRHGASCPSAACAFVWV